MNSSAYITLLLGVLSLCTSGTDALRKIRRLNQVLVATEPEIGDGFDGKGQDSGRSEDSEAASSRRVQRKLVTAPQEDVDTPQGETQFMEYQGVMGRPGIDFPVLPNIPRTEFSCRKVKSSGYYADLDTGCQVFHICDGGRKISFLCPNGTIFRQSHLICDWWFRVDCGRSVELYEESAEQLAHDQMLYKKRAEALAKAMQAGETTLPPITYDQKQGAPKDTPRNNQAYYDETYERNTVLNSQQRRRQRPSSSTSTTTTQSTPPQTPPSAKEYNQQDQERQIPAETASFAANSRHRYTNELTQQQGFYIQPATQPQPQPQSTPRYHYPEAIKPSTYRRPNIFSTTTTSTTSTTTTTTTTPLPPPESTFRSPQVIFRSTTARPILPGQANPFSFSQPDFVSQSFGYRDVSSTPQTHNATFLHFSERLPSSFPKIFTPNVVTTPSPVSTSFAPNAYLPFSTPAVSFPPVTVVRIPASTLAPLVTSLRNPSTLTGINPDVINSLAEIAVTARPIYKGFPTRPDPTGVNNLHSLATYYGTSSILGHRSHATEHSSTTATTPTSTTSTTTTTNAPTTTTTVGPTPPPYLMTTGKLGNPGVSELLLRSHSGSPDTSPELDESAFTTTTRSNANATSDDVLPSVLTKATKDSYTFLFSEKLNNTLQEDTGSGVGVRLSTNPEATDTEHEREGYFNREESGRVIQTTTEKRQSATVEPISDDVRLKQSNDLRELAQVFSRALSAYLENPESFKEILAQVRPTEPNPNDITTPSAEDEVLDFSDTAGGKINSDDIAGEKHSINIDIRQINSLVTNSDNGESDNSIEATTVVLESFDTKANNTMPGKHHTTLRPTSLAIDINNIVYNSSQLEYLTQPESSEDSSYFPTAGGVDDSSRPRYGGFQNNTRKFSSYSPYGSEVAPNITGTPLSFQTATQPVTPKMHDLNPSIVIEGEAATTPNYQSLTERLDLPEAHVVNSLLQENVGENSLYNPFPTGSEELTEEKSPSTQSLLQREQDYYGPSGDQEKLLIASGSQSFVSGDNYVSYTGKGTKDSNSTKNTLKASLYSLNSYSNYAEAALSQNTESPVVSITAENAFEPDNSTSHGSYFRGGFENIEVSNTTTEATAYSIREELTESDKTTETITTGETVTTELASTFDEHNISYQNINLGNGVTLERTIKATTSRTKWALPNQVATELEPETTTLYSADDEQVTTTEPIEDRGSSGPTKFQEMNSTMPPDMLTSVSGMENDNFHERAKEMFGSLNETAAGALLEVMNKADSNITIRKLVLLLVTDMSKDNATPGETRTSLIQALINYEDQDIANTVVGTTAGQETTTEVSTTIREDGTTELGATTDMTTTEGVTTKDTTTTELTTQEITTTEATTTTTTTTTTKPPRQPLRRVRVSRVRPIYHSRVEGPNYRRGKGYRNVDTETAVHGAAERRTHPQEIERINSAKLYIPPADAKLPYNSDARAVELLKSLYNLAAKWG